MGRVFALGGVFHISLVRHQGVLVCWLQDSNGLSFCCLGRLFSVEGTLVFLIFCDAGLCAVSEGCARMSLDWDKTVILKDCPAA